MKKEIKEIIYPEKTLEDFGYEKTGKKCPNCGKELYFGQAPCPEGRNGCLVIHYAYQCLKGCGKHYHF